MRKWHGHAVRGYSNTNAPYRSADIARVMVACVDLNNENLFLETFEMCPYKVPASTFKSVGTGLLRYGPESLLPK